MKYRITRAIPCYTGGGIYVFTGRLQSGEWFVADNAPCSVRLLNEDPDGTDEAFYAEWQEEHLIRDLDDKEAEHFYKNMVKWVKLNKPYGNYDIYEL